MSVIKHEPRKRKPPKAELKPSVPSLPDAPSITVDVDMSGVETELANLAHSLKSYVVNSYDAENKLKIFTGPSGSGFHPVLIALEESDTMDRIIEATERIATAFERIADAMAKS